MCLAARMLCWCLPQHDAPEAPLEALRSPRPPLGAQGDPKEAAGGEVVAGAERELPAEPLRCTTSSSFRLYQAPHTSLLHQLSPGEIPHLCSLTLLFYLILFFSPSLWQDIPVLMRGRSRETEAGSGIGGRWLLSCHCHPSHAIILAPYFRASQTFLLAEKRGCEALSSAAQHCFQGPRCEQDACLPLAPRILLFPCQQARLQCQKVPDCQK